MFDKLLGTPCIRPGCGHRNPKGSEFCEHCDISLAFNRPAVLDGNRWSPAPDEMAVFYKTRRLKGLFTRNLYVPPGMVGWMLQGQESKALEEGENTAQTLFERMNNFFRDGQGEVLICRRDAMDVPFTFNDMPSAELLDIRANVTLKLRVVDVLAFRTRFMQMEGAVTVAQLQALLAGPLRQALADHLGARHIDEMMRDVAAFRAGVDNAVARGLAATLLSLGLQLELGTELGLHHDALNEQNQLRARLWLLRRQADVQAQHDKAQDEIYDQQQWAKIHRREKDLRRRHEEGRLTGEEADLAHTLRLGEVLQYERILEASTREAAARLGAADKVAELEGENRRRTRERGQRELGDQWKDEDEQASWKHVRALAGIRSEGELRATRARRDEQEMLDQERAKNTLARLRAEADLAAAKQLGDETERHVQEGIHLERLAKAAVREQQLAQVQAQVTISDLAFAQEMRQHEQRRIQAYEDGAMQERLQDLRRKGEAEDIKLGVGKLKGLAEVGHQMDKDALELKLIAQRETMRIEAEVADKARADALKEALAKQAFDLEHTRILGALPVEALVALADSPEKVAGLVRLGTMRSFESMEADQIRAAQPQAAPVPQPQGPWVQAPAAPSVDPAQQTQQVYESVLDRMARLQTESTAALSKAIEEMRTTAIGVAQAAKGVPQAVPPAPAAPMPVAPTVVFAAAPPAPAAPAMHTMPLAMKTCPHCNAANLATASYCGHCSSKFA